MGSVVELIIEKSLQCNPTIPHRLGALPLGDGYAPRSWRIGVIHPVGTWFRSSSPGFVFASTRLIFGISTTARINRETGNYYKPTVSSCAIFFLGLLIFACAQHRRTPRPFVEMIRRKGLLPFGSQEKISRIEPSSANGSGV